MLALSRPSRLLTIAVACAAAAALALAAGPPPAPAASSSSYKRCSLSEKDQQPSSGHPTYNLSLKQKRTRCSTAKKVARAFHRCRSATSYRCTKRVLRRWTCSARKTSKTSTLFYARFTCKWGPRRVTSTYQQNT